jgi:flavin-binding protein dodecin
MCAHVYKVIELAGSSETSCDEAIRNAIKRAARTIDHLDWFEVIEQRGVIANGDVEYFQVKLKIGFRLEER